MPGLSNKSYGSVLGANDKIRVGAIGVNSRGMALATNFAMQPGCEVVHICDVDSRALAKCADAVEKIQNNKVRRDRDLRKMLESPEMDLVLIATPDHWHAPAALMAMQAGKDVYLEKPCSYAPHEGEMLIQGAAKYRRLLQMGNQRRSWPNVIKGIEEVKKGTIGRVYFGKAWSVSYTHLDVYKRQTRSRAMRYAGSVRRSRLRRWPSPRRASCVRIRPAALRDRPRGGGRFRPLRRRNRWRCGSAWLPVPGQRQRGSPLRGG